MEWRNCEVLLKYLLRTEIRLAPAKQQTQWTCNKRINLIVIMAKKIVVGVALSHIRRNSENDKGCSKKLFPHTPFLFYPEEYNLSYKWRALYEENNKQLIVSRLYVGLCLCRNKPQKYSRPWSHSKFLDCKLHYTLIISVCRPCELPRRERAIVAELGRTNISTLESFQRGFT